jgi:hypothetical protein
LSFIVCCNSKRRVRSEARVSACRAAPKGVAYGWQNDSSSCVATFLVRSLKSKPCLPLAMIRYDTGGGGTAGRTRVTRLLAVWPAYGDVERSMVGDIDNVLGLWKGETGRKGAPLPLPAVQYRLECSIEGTPDNNIQSRLRVAPWKTSDRCELLGSNQEISAARIVRKFFCFAAVRQRVVRPATLLNSLGLPGP